ncbi:MAG: hypothetical protein ACK5QC_15370 [Bacteroidota bacterium]
MKKKSTGFIIAFCIITASIISQNKQIDSLKVTLSKSINDSIRCKNYILLGEELLNYNSDSSLFYFEKAKSLSSLNYEKVSDLQAKQIYCQLL